VSRIDDASIFTVNVSCYPVGVNTPPNYFNNQLKLIRIDPGMGVNHKHMIYPTLLLALANHNRVEFHSFRMTTGGEPDCSKITEVKIQSNPKPKN